MLGGIGAACNPVLCPVNAVGEGGGFPCECANGYAGNITWDAEALRCDIELKAESDGGGGLWGTTCFTAVTTLCFFFRYEGFCSDIDECSDGTHNCDIANGATCFNALGTALSHAIIWFECAFTRPFFLVSHGNEQSVFEGTFECRCPIGSSGNGTVCVQARCMQPRVTTAETAATIPGGYAYGAASAPPANDYDWFVPCMVKAWPT